MKLIDLIINYRELWQFIVQYTDTYTTISSLTIVNKQIRSIIDYHQIAYQFLKSIKLFKTPRYKYLRKYIIYYPDYCDVLSDRSLVPRIHGDLPMYKNISSTTIQTMKLKDTDELFNNLLYASIVIHNPNLTKKLLNIHDYSNKTYKLTLRESIKQNQEEIIDLILKKLPKIQTFDSIIKILHYPKIRIGTLQQILENHPFLFKETSNAFGRILSTNDPEKIKWFYHRYIDNYDDIDWETVMITLTKITKSSPVMLYPCIGLTLKYDENHKIVSSWN